MSRFIHRTGIVLGSVSAVALVWTLTTHDRTADLERRWGGPLNRPPLVGERFDEPDQAAIYERMKRQGPSPDFDAAAAYRAALAHRDTMPSYSTRLGAPLRRMQSADGRRPTSSQ